MSRNVLCLCYFIFECSQICKTSLYGFVFEFLFLDMQLFFFSVLSTATFHFGNNGIVEFHEKDSPLFINVVKINY